MRDSQGQLETENNVRTLGSISPLEKKPTTGKDSAVALFRAVGNKTALSEADLALLRELKQRELVESTLALDGAPSRQ